VQSFKALRCKLEGRGFGSRWDHFHWLNPSGPTLALGSTQLLTSWGGNSPLAVFLLSDVWRFASAANHHWGKYAVVQSFKALRCKLEGRGFGSRWDHFHWLNPSGRTLALGSTQLLTEKSTRHIFWCVKAAGA
jgi:hypothetical protein